MSVRTSLVGPDIPEHGQPFPTATKVGSMVFSSAIIGHDPVTHKLPEDIQSQVRNVFQIIRNILARAGGSPENIGKVVVYLRSRDDRKHVNPEWEKMFPDPASRPVRHTLEHQMGAGILIQVEFIAAGL